MTMRSPLAALLVLGLCVAVQAAGDIKIEFDGKPAQFEAPPVERGDVICVPMVGVFEALGAAVHYDSVTRTVKALRGTTVVLITIGQSTAMVNLKPHPLQVPAFTLEGKVMVPLRFVSESMGATVAWDPVTRVVSIRKTPEKTITLPTVSVSGTPEPPPTRAPVAITEFRHSATSPLHPGDTLTVTLVGTPHGQASFSIPGVTDKAPLKEGPDGTYTADFRLPGGVAVKQVAVYGILAVGTERAPLATAPMPLSVQPLVPHLEKPVPAPGAVTDERTPRITGFFEMLGGTLDVASVRVVVNGNDVTKQAYVTREFFTYTPNQPLNGHVKIEVSGRATPAGEWSDSWTFDIQGGVAARIQSATHGPTAVFKAGDVVEVTMVGTAGGKATFDIGTWRSGIEMRESSAGTYIGSYRVQPDDRVEAATVVVHLRQGAEESTAQVSIPITLGVGPVSDGSVTLSVTAPRPDDRVGKSFVVRGQTAPGAKVTVNVIGHLPYVERDVRMLSAEGTADGQGAYAVKIEVPLMVGGVRLLLVVTATASGKRAGPVQVPVIGK